MALSYNAFGVRGEDYPTTFFPKLTGYTPVKHMITEDSLYIHEIVLSKWKQMTSYINIIYIYKCIYYKYI